MFKPAVSRLTFVGTGQEETREDFAQAVAEGLGSNPRTLPCRFLYDRTGSALFEEICDLPEYYLTRSEQAILDDRAAEIVERLPPETQLAELGSGSSTKTRTLIEAFLNRHGELHYLPVDISPSMLAESSEALLKDYQELQITAVAAEYERGLQHLEEAAASPRLLLWLGSNVGNFHPSEAGAFLGRVRDSLDEEDRFLMGVDLRKGREILEPAYDDPRGVTESFNKNLLARINDELDADFDLDAFAHRAQWRELEGRVKIELECLAAQTVQVGALDLAVELDEGERIHTEDSFKYSPEEIRDLAARGEFSVEASWFDANRWFSLNLLAPA